MALNRCSACRRPFPAQWRGRRPAAAPPRSSRPGAGAARRRSSRPALPQLGAHLQAVDHHVDVVLLGLLELGQLVEFVGLAVDAKTHVALRLHVGKHIQELALSSRAPSAPGSSAGCPRARPAPRPPSGSRSATAAAGRARGSRACPRGRTAGAGSRGSRSPCPRWSAGCGWWPFARSRWRRQALDHVHVGLVHQLQELPRVGGQALHIAALAFGVQRVEGQAGLARTRQTRDHHQLVARDVQVDVLEVVRARAADADVLLLQGARKVFAVGRRGSGCWPSVR